MPGRPLGTETNRAYIYLRGGGTQLLDLGDSTAIEWGRARDAFSTAQVTVQADHLNFGQLGDVHVWAHELVIYRGVERVWEGPIRFIDYGTSDTIIYAVDVLGWLAKRRITHTRRTGTTLALPTDEMALILERAFANDDPNVLAHALQTSHVLETGITRDVRKGSGYYADDFTGLAGKKFAGSFIEAHFTVIGRSVQIWTDYTVFGRLDTFIPERDTTAEVRVVEDGDMLATTATFTDSDDRVRTKVHDGVGSGDVDPVTGVSDYYGQHDFVGSVENTSTNAALDSRAFIATRLLFPAYVYITNPTDVPLLPAAPFHITELVPGAGVPVQSSATPRRIDTSMVLSSVKVTQTSSGESVAISLVPSFDALEVL